MFTDFQLFFDDSHPSSSTFHASRLAHAAGALQEAAQEGAPAARGGVLPRHVAPELDPQVLREALDLPLQVLVRNSGRYRLYRV